MSVPQYPADPDGNILAPQRESWAIPEEIAGITIPDTPLVRETTDYVRGLCAPIVFNHSLRVYVLGEMIGRARNLDFDSELFYLGAICHDLGQTEEFIGNERFEVDGADAAVNWLRSRGVEDSRTETVWDAIALHTAASIAVRKRPEISLVAQGAAADIMGPPEDIAATEVAELMRTIPRVHMKRDYPRVVVEMARRRPVETTFANFISAIGQEHIPGFVPISVTQGMRNSPYAE